MNTLWRERVLVQLRGNVVGPFPVSDLRRLSGFTPQTMISFPGSEKWAPAFRVLNQAIFDCPLDISPGEGSTSPPMDTFPAVIFPQKTYVRAKISDFVAFDPRAARTSRWFWRLAVFNLMLVLAAWGAWSRPPLRALLQNDFQRETRHLQQQLKPLTQRLDKQMTLRSRTQSLHRALQDFGKMESDFVDAFKAR